MIPPLTKSAVFAALPPPQEEDLTHLIRPLLAERPSHKLVVLDDDPTGTQTVHDVPVLTVWDVETLQAEFARQGYCFYILTNSRSLGHDAAVQLNRELARNLREASAGASFTIVSRSDSTLRGHFPLETDVLAEELGPFDATIVFPYFEAGGRYTIHDIHYVAEGDQLVPAADTPFARDAAFGYRHSNLRDWVEDKTSRRVNAADVVSISIEELRSSSATQTVTAKLCELPRGSVCVVNAAHPRDAESFALATLMAEQAGARFLYRTAAQFVAARLGIGSTVYRTANGAAHSSGGLIVVGSYVPKTTEQLTHLLQHSAVVPIELQVETLLGSDRLAAINEASTQTDAALSAGQDVVVFTSRTLISGTDPASSLEIGRQISEALVALVRSLAVRPRYLIAKGGITSSDLATRGLSVKRAMVMGQILPGVPVWQLGAETKFPGLPYVVFPGNVGKSDALTEAVKIFRSAKHS